MTYNVLSGTLSLYTTLHLGQLAKLSVMFCAHQGMPLSNSVITSSPTVHAITVNHVPLVNHDS